MATLPAFATHFYSFFLLLLLAKRFVALPVFSAARSLGIMTQGYSFNFIFTIVLPTLCGVYLYFALRRVYQQGRTVTLLKCVTLAFSVAVILQTCRFVLFFTTFNTV